MPLPPFVQAFAPSTAPYDAWATFDPWPPASWQEGYVHTIKRIGADEIRCQVDRRTGQLVCDGRMTGCFPTADGSVVCGPGQTLGAVEGARTYDECVAQLRSSGTGEAAARAACDAAGPWPGEHQTGGGGAPRWLPWAVGLGALALLAGTVFMKGSRRRR